MYKFSSHTSCDVLVLLLLATVQGIASTLLRLALDDLASRGYHTVKLHVASQNVAAQSLYLKMGFVQTGYKEDYYWQDQDRDAVVMRLQLLPLLPETEVSCSFL